MNVSVSVPGPSPAGAGGGPSVAFAAHSKTQGSNSALAVWRLSSHALRRARRCSHPVLLRLHAESGPLGGADQRRSWRPRRAGAAAANGGAASASAPPGEQLEAWNAEARATRLAHLEEQALDTLRKALDAFERPTFPCALIAGDVVLLHLLSRAGAFQMPKSKVVFIDTFHLFPETYQFLKECEELYSFKAEKFHAAGCDTRDDYVAKHGSDLFIVDIDEYDRICKVEPFGRALESLKVDGMINGRRRDHGSDRAHLEVFEGGEGMAKIQPLAYWEFRDCFDYLEKHGVKYHPLHDQGFPSIGDVQTTLPVPREKWFEYGGERSGRFQGLKNKDGSEKTECGIHVGDAREVAATSSVLPAASSSLQAPSSSLVRPA